MELDIVAYRDKTLVVVEVKTRKNNEFLRPEEAVTLRKIKNIIQATDAYIRMFDIPFDIRFDIITLVGENEDFQIEHIKCFSSVICRPKRNEFRSNAIPNLP